MDSTNCSGCSSCGGCSGCSGCRSEYSLTEGEIAVLSELAEIPFLPIGRKHDGETPVYISDGKEITDDLMWLKLKGLISLDYDIPLSGFDYAEYAKYPVKGSMALTAAGQSVVEALEIQGVSE